MLTSRKPRQTLCTFLAILFSTIVFQTSLSATGAVCDRWLVDANRLLATTCPFVTENDRIAVLDRNANGIPDFDNDVWLFDIDADGDTQLIVKFETGSKAFIYDDRNDDGQVDYDLTEGDVAVTESESWTVQVEADGPWQSAEGQPNYNLTFTVDGTPETIYGGAPSPKITQNDGAPDWEYRIYDEEEDGIPDFWTFRLLTPFPTSWSLMRFSTFHNLSQTQPIFPQQSFLWPYLRGEELVKSSDEKPSYGARMFEDAPFIDVDWESGQILTVGLYGFPIEDGWWVNSFAPAKEDQIARINFESPHAWYDLADDHDRHPELNIRVVHWNANDENWIKSATPVNEVRYSWNQANADGLAFDFKLGLVGTQSIGKKVRFGPFDIAMIPWQDLPGWIISQEWQTATFIAVEGINYQSSEGIYEWAPATSADGSAEEFVTGRIDDAPTEMFHELRIGVRGEYTTDLGGKPWLYISPIDRKLHLVGASTGHWKLDEDKIIHYRNNLGDYFDEWWVEKEGRVIERLLVLENHLLYAAGEQFSIKKTNDISPPQRYLPPANHQDWQRLSEKLENNSGAFDSSNLAEIFGQFAGQEQTIVGINLLDASISKDGLRFTMELRSDYNTSGSTILDIEELEPGAYVAIYQDQSLSLSRMTPATIMLTSEFQEDNSVVVAKPYAIMTQIRNSGLEEAVDLHLVAEAWQGESRVRFADDSINAPSNSETNKIYTWHPPRKGKWHVAISIYDDTGDILSTTELTVLVGLPQPLRLPNLLSEGFGQWSPLVLLLLTLTGLVVLTSGMLLRSREGQVGQKGEGR